MLKQPAPRQRDFICRYVREHKTTKEWAEIFGVAISGIEKWKRTFAEEIEAEREIVDKELKAKFDDIRDEAFQVLLDNLRNPDPRVNEKAWKYILDHAGYNGTKKIDFSTNNTKDFTPNEIAAIKEKILMIDQENQ